jgi:hypothetical protein
MFWIILIFALLIVMFLGFRITKDTDYLFLAIPIIALSLIMFISFLVGIEVYPQLVSKKSEAVSLQNEIQTVKEAYYDKSKSGILIGGSLDNMSQSKALSDYIKNYAIKKSEFNKDLVYYKTYLKSDVMFWFKNNIFISDKILEMEEIK